MAVRKHPCRKKGGGKKSDYAPERTDNGKDRKEGTVMSKREAFALASGDNHRMGREGGELKFERKAHL